MHSTALIIVDMQVGMTWPSSGDRNNVNAEKNIAHLLTHWRKMSAPIMHVHHRSRTIGSPFYPGQPGIEVQPALAPLGVERVIVKQVPDAFIGTGLESRLRQSAISSLVIVGVSTNNSVEATARTAGNLGFQTYVIADACFAFAKKDHDGVRRSAQEVHAMSLANLHEEYATVMSSIDALKLLHE